MSIGSALLYAGVLLVFASQVVAIATWWVLSRMTLDRVTAQPRLMIPFFVTFGIAAALPRTTLGGAIVEAEPERGPVMQRRFRRALAGTLAGVLIAYAGLAA